MCELSADWKQTSHHPLNVTSSMGYLKGLCWVRSCSRVRPSRFARELGLPSHMYADDTQLYIAFKPVGEGELATERVAACVNDMSSWMRKNKLQLNDSKTGHDHLFCAQPLKG